MLRALRHRNYRLFFFGQGISLVGTWMQAVAMGWLVYRLTASPFLLGVVGFLSQAPSFFFTPFAGVIVDRYDRRRILFVTQALSMVQAFALAAIVATGVVEVWYLLILALLLGIVAALDAPARQAFVVELVGDRADVGNAIALNSIIFNGARLVGPFIAGIVIAFAGEWPCFLANGVSYFAALGSLMMMRIDRSPRAMSAGAITHLREGIVYAWRLLPVRAILLLLGLTGLVGMPYAVLMPVFARNVLGGGPREFGLLMSAAGVGALFGAVYLALRRSVVGLARQIPLAAALFAASLIAFAFSNRIAVSVTALFFVGFGMIVHAAASNTVIQTLIDDDKRGRVMALFTMAFLGMLPFGSLLAGWLAVRIGAPATVAAGGVVSLLGAVAFARALPAVRQAIRPIYRRMGIIPDASAGNST